MIITSWVDKMLKTNVIYNYDCLVGLKDIEDGSIDLIVTDPPYLINYHSDRIDSSHRFCNPIVNDDNENIIVDIMPELYRVLKDNSAMYMFCSPKTIDFFMTEIKKYFNIKNLIIWVKDSGTVGDCLAGYAVQYEICIYANKGRKFINGKRLTDVWTNEKIPGLKRVLGHQQLHQNQKPLELIKLMIEKSSSMGELVLDPFMGSATTAVAARELGRDYVGYEIDPYYYKISLQRLEGIEPSGQTSMFTDFDSINKRISSAGMQTE